MIAPIEFHERRAAQERRRAEALPPGRVRDLHDELAGHHRDLAVSLRAAGVSTLTNEQG